MRATRVVLTAPAFDEDLGFLQRIEEFPVQELIPQLCSEIPSFRQASTTASPLPSSISMVRNCPMISSAVYRFRAMPPPFAGRKLNSRSGLVYRGQVTRLPPASVHSSVEAERKIPTIALTSSPARSDP